MIDPSFDGEVATITPHPPTMQELEVKIDQLNNALASMTADRDFWQARAHDRQMMIDNLEQYVKDNFDYIDEDVSQRIVEIFDLEITKEYDVQVTVTFTGTVAAPLNFDMDNLENELEPNLGVSFYADGIQVDFMEDRVEVEWSEN